MPTASLFSQGFQCINFVKTFVTLECSNHSTPILCGKSLLQATIHDQSRQQTCWLKTSINKPDTNSLFGTSCVRVATRMPFLSGNDKLCAHPLAGFTNCREKPFHQSFQCDLVRHWGVRVGGGGWGGGRGGSETEISCVIVPTSYQNIPWGITTEQLKKNSSVISGWRITGFYLLTCILTLFTRQ
jgi:hypothetical protein